MEISGRGGCFWALAFLVLAAHGQELPTNYEYYLEGGIRSGCEDRPDGFFLNDRNITLLSGALHYFRVHPALWRDRLRKLRAMGANTVDTYVPWNLHEPSPGKYDFGDGDDDLSPFLDIVTFIKIAQEEDLFVLVRPGPYICSEFEFGGMPSWLLRDRDLKVRTSDPKFEAAVERYFGQLFPLLINLQFIYGGPIIGWQIENEYGATTSLTIVTPLDQQYLINLHQMMKRMGLKGMFFTSDTPANPGGDKGFVPGVLRTANFKNNPNIQLNALQSQQPNKPSMVMEFWTGWFDHWMEAKHSVFPVAEYLSVLEGILEFPASVNLYMWHGGTSWGFLNGANVYPAFPFYEADVSSYDYDAPLSEAGDYTEKYLATQQMFDLYNPVKTRLPPMPAESAKTAYPTVPVTEQLAYDSIIAQIPSDEQFLLREVDSMEMLDMNDGAGQSYGYILYRKRDVALSENSTVTISGQCHGIATVLVDAVTKTPRLTSIDDIRGFGYWIMRDATLALDAASAGTRTLDILVENFGRNNFGRLVDYDQRKGLYDGPVLVDDEAIVDWEVKALQFKGDWVRGLSGWEAATLPITSPTLFRGTFTVDEPQDTWLDMRTWGKGVVFINGFNLGRYFDVGPLRSLYLPAQLLNVGENKITIFEQTEAAAEIVFSAVPLLGEVLVRKN